MCNNPILDELRAVREKLLAEAGGTLDGLVDRLQAEEEQSKRPRFQRRQTGGSLGAPQADEFAADNLSSPIGDR